MSFALICLCILLLAFAVSVFVGHLIYEGRECEKLSKELKEMGETLRAKR